jgi:hypothetical protein
VTLDHRVLCQRPDTPEPEPIAGLEGATELGIGSEMLCIKNAALEVLCALPQIDGRGWQSPSKIPGLGDVAQLAVDSVRACAVRRDGAAYCWGSFLRRGENGVWPPIPALE